MNTYSAIPDEYMPYQPPLQLPWALGYHRLIVPMTWAHIAAKQAGEADAAGSPSGTAPCSRLRWPGMRHRMPALLSPLGMYFLGGRWLESCLDGEGLGIPVLCSRESKEEGASMEGRRGFAF